MLSKDAIKLLKWLEKHDRWMTPDKIKKDCRIFNERSFKALKAQKMIDIQMSMDDDNWAEYRINDSGKAYLDGLRAKRLPELREWISVVIGVGTFATGVLLSDPIKAFLSWVWEKIT